MPDLKTKLFEVLKTFSKEDYVKFGHFVNSEYFNSSVMLRNLYSVIQKNTPLMPYKQITRENLFEELYPGKEYREGTIVNLLSGLYKLSEDYIALEKFKEEPMGMERYLLKGLGARRLNKFLTRNYEKLMEELNRTEIQNEDYFFNRYDIDVSFISFTPTESSYMETALIQGCHDKLLDLMMLKFLNTYIFMINNKKYGFDHNFNMSYIDYIIKFIENNNFDHNPAVLIHFNLMMLLKEDDEKYYFNLKELLQLHFNILESSEKWTVYISMANFAEIKIEDDRINKIFPKELYSLYKTIIEKKIYKVEDWYPYIHNRLYLNVVLNSLLQKEFEWAENFINIYKSELSEEYRENSYNLCCALFHFAKKEFEKSLKYINKVQYEDAFYFLHIKALMLQLYYELNLFDSAFSLLDSYKHYLKEKTSIPPAYKIRHKNFVNVMNKMIKIKCSPDIYDKPEFDVTSEEFKNIAKKEWIFEKMEEIKKMI